MFDPMHNAVDHYYAVNGSLKGSWKGLDKGIGIVNWHGGLMGKNCQFFADLGLKQILSGYYDGDEDGSAIAQVAGEHAGRPRHRRRDVHDLGGQVRRHGRLGAEGLGRRRDEVEAVCAVTPPRARRLRPPAWGGKHHRTVLQGTESQREDVERVVLIEPPRRLRPLLGEPVDGALDVARGEIDERLFSNARVAVFRRALPVTARVHVVEQAADVLAGEIALERPRRVRVAERQSPGSAPRRASCPCSSWSWRDRPAAVDDELDAAQRQELEAGGGDDHVGLELRAGLQASCPSR